MSETALHTSTVYGPVKSWRVGMSLGIDLIRDNSTCSFNCIYCQLGDIQDKSIERRQFVSVDEVMADLKVSDWQSADVITFSGSGEPTLATNLGEALTAIKAYTGKRIVVLTNATLLYLPEVRHQLQHADEIAVKLDAADEAGLKQVNRPVAGVTLERIIEGAVALRQEFKGKVAIQTMFMPVNSKQVDALADIIKTIQPDEVQLNTPKRPYPLEWHVDSRGNHTGSAPYKTVPLKTVTTEMGETIESILREKTHIPIISRLAQA